MIITSTAIISKNKDAEAAVWAIMHSVPDPEVPVISITDLGVVRGVKVIDPTSVEIIITPTYTGCPAMDMIAMNIRLALLEQGYKNIQIESVLSPAWTTDWITESGRQKLKAYGIAPPQLSATKDTHIVECPQCGSVDTKLLSQFGSTACKALYQCQDCKEPFDHFKCH